MAVAADIPLWQPVLIAAREERKSVGRCPERDVIRAAEKKAREWAAAELDGVVQQAKAGGDIVAMRKRLGVVKQKFAGEPSVLFNADQFVLVFDKLQAYTGTLVPKGKKGTKFEMIFDDGSDDGFAQFVSEYMGIVAGRPAQTTMGQSAKMIFVKRANGTALLKIKASVVESDPPMSRVTLPES